MLEACAEREDDWGLKVKSRVEFVSDLPAADAVYHQACSVNFRTGKQIPKKYIPDVANVKRFKLGRPQDAVQAEAFMKVMENLQQNDEQQTTVGDLIEKMESYLAGTDVTAYGFTHMKEQIKKHFGNKIIITEVNGKQNVVTMWSATSTPLHDFYSSPKQELEKKRIIETAAKLIKNDIKTLVQEREYYPEYKDMVSIDAVASFLPESLKTFLENLFTSKDAKIKIASIGQAIIQSTRPRVIVAPLQLGLGVQLHHHFASRFLVDTLNSLGFCCSYAEVNKFERCAAVTQGTEIPNLTSETFVQYAADNVDHNTCTLDGYNTFHGMGMIAAITPGTSSRQKIPRVSVIADELAAVGKVNIQQFIPKETMQELQYQ